MFTLVGNVYTINFYEQDIIPVLYYIIVFHMTSQKAPLR